MQVNVITSMVAGQETVATADVQAFMAAMEKTIGRRFQLHVRYRLWSEFDGP